MRISASYSRSFCFSAVLKLVCLGLLALLPVVALAQAPTGTISGIVLDQNGAVVPNDFATTTIAEMASKQTTKVMARRKSERKEPTQPLRMSTTVNRLTRTNSRPPAR